MMRIITSWPSVVLVLILVLLLGCAVLNSPSKDAPDKYQTNDINTILLHLQQHNQVSIQNNDELIVCSDYRLVPNKPEHRLICASEQRGLFDMSLDEFKALLVNNKAYLINPHIK